MKSTIISLSLLLMTLIIGCGGGDNNCPPPQPPQLGMNNPIDQQQLQTMFALANQTKSSCASSGTQSLLPLVMMMSSNNGAGAPQMMPILPQLAGDCSDSLINFIMMFTTMKNGQYANHPEPKKWFMSQMSGMMNMVGANFQNRGININPTQLPQLYNAGWQLVQRDIFSNPQFQQVRPAVCTGAGQYGLGC